MFRERTSDYVPSKTIPATLSRINVIRGARYIQPSGIGNFPTFGRLTGVPRPPRYHTRFCGFQLSCWKPSKTNANLNYALLRLLRTRGSEEKELEFHRNQHRFTATSTLTDAYYRSLQFDDFTTEIEELIAKYKDPHPKRPLRVAATEDMDSMGTLSIFEDVLRKLVNAYKVKTLERIDPESVARAIGDLGVHKSLRGFVSTKLLKRAQETPFTIGGAEARFVPRSTERLLRQTFKRHYDAKETGDLMLDFFSDDMVLTINGKTYELDISKCDTSHGSSVFDSLLKNMPNNTLGESIRNVVDQLRQPVSIRAPEMAPGEKAAKIELYTIDLVTGQRTPALLSGSTITTAINNYACHLIFESIVRENTSKPISDMAGVKRAAALAGYLLKVREVTDLRSLQFLKHSPVVDKDGEIRALLNLGVFFRSQGSIAQDLPGRGDLYSRALPFCAQLLRSMYPNVRCPMLDAAKKSFDIPAKDLEVARLTLNKEHYRLRELSEENAELIYLTDEEFIGRYLTEDALQLSSTTELTPPSAEEVGTALRLRPFEFMSSEGIDLILRMDYKLRLLREGEHRVPSVEEWSCW